MAIESFDGPNRFLSNFFPARVVLDDMSFPTVENAFQAAKVEDVNARLPFTTCSAGQSKRMGRAVPLRGGWNDMRVDIMRNLLVQKFEKPELREALLATGNQRLVEGNWWGDRFWGICKGEGRNELGKLLMQIREEIREQMNPS